MSKRRKIRMKTGGYPQKVIHITAVQNAGKINIQKSYPQFINKLLKTAIFRTKIAVFRYQFLKSYPQSPFIHAKMNKITACAL